ncbi:MAG: hypothetical protein VCD31_11815 [Alphaproteobacteria bacterium]
MDERISILQDLYAEGFLSEDKLMARLGSASPDISEISLRLEALESLLQRGMISSQGYAVERGHVLDDLAPIMAMPEGRSPQSHTAAAAEGAHVHLAVPLRKGRPARLEDAEETPWRPVGESILARERGRFGPRQGGLFPRRGGLASRSKERG